MYLQASLGLVQNVIRQALAADHLASKQDRKTTVRLSFGFYRSNSETKIKLNVCVIMIIIILPNMKTVFKVIIVLNLSHYNSF